jgi:hypothetical protein
VFLLLFLGVLVPSSALEFWRTVRQSFHSTDTTETNPINLMDLLHIEGMRNTAQIWRERRQVRLGIAVEKGRPLTRIACSRLGTDRVKSEAGISKF